jgi:transglutaminase-like putative cysteine protease
LARARPTPGRRFIFQAAGWITFDPTNSSVGGANVIPVAVVRDIRQAVPVAGSFVGPSDALIGMNVEVSVTG